MNGNKRAYYYLGDDFPGVYFTQREVDCLLYLLKGYSIVSAADALDLSHRTVEFYVKNMRMKTGAQNKRDLIEKMRSIDLIGKMKNSSSSSEFLSAVDDKLKDL